jgi:DNA ligase-1
VLLPQILLEQPFRKRRSLLIERFSPFNLEGVSRFTHVESCDSEAGRDQIEEFWELALESKCEGLMIKVRPEKEEQPSISDSHSPAT